MNTPIEIASRINPSFIKCESNENVVIHEFSPTICHNDSELVIPFPYKKNTYWTHFQYTSDKEDFEICIVFVTSDFSIYEIDLSKHPLKQNVWHDTLWPLPSINTKGTLAKVYIKIRPLFRDYLYDFKLQIIGFQNLFPDVRHYLLVTRRNECQFVFSNFEDNDPQYPQGAIHNYENDDYIRDLAKDACTIKLIKKY
jgi:hypothetical protein